MDVWEDSSSSSDENEQQWLEQCYVIFTAMITVTVNSSKFFDATELIRRTQGWVN
jgi:hypothetical protein